MLPFNIIILLKYLHLSYLAARVAFKNPALFDNVWIAFADCASVIKLFEESIIELVIENGELTVELDKSFNCQFSESEKEYRVLLS